MSTYGKSVHNVRRVIRAGLHGPAYYEALPNNTDNELRRIKTRRSDIVWEKDRYTIPERGANFNTFRPNMTDLRILHLTDSYRTRHTPWQVKVAKEENLFSYYVKYLSPSVRADLDRREKKRNAHGTNDTQGLQ